MTESAYELSTINEEITDTQFQELVEKTFAQALASAIMSNFPVASIIAIFKGSKASKMIAQIDEITARTGKQPGGKRMAARILSKYGFISGIALSAFLAFYFAFIIIYIFCLFAITSGY